MASTLQGFKSFYTNYNTPTHWVLIALYITLNKIFQRKEKFKWNNIKSIHQFITQTHTHLTFIFIELCKTKCLVNILNLTDIIKRAVLTRAWNLGSTRQTPIWRRRGLPYPWVIVPSLANRYEYIKLVWLYLVLGGVWVLFSVILQWKLNTIEFETPNPPTPL